MDESLVVDVFFLSVSKCAVQKPNKTELSDRIVLLWFLLMLNKSILDLIWKKHKYYASDPRQATI